MAEEEEAVMEDLEAIALRVEEVEDLAGTVCSTYVLPHFYS